MADVQFSPAVEGMFKGQNIPGSCPSGRSTLPAHTLPQPPVQLDIRAELKSSKNKLINHFRAQS